MELFLCLCERAHKWNRLHLPLYPNEMNTKLSKIIFHAQTCNTTSNHTNTACHLLNCCWWQLTMRCSTRLNQKKRALLRTLWNGLIYKYISYPKTDSTRSIWRFANNCWSANHSISKEIIKIISFTSTNVTPFMNSLRSIFPASLALVIIRKLRKWDLQQWILDVTGWIQLNLLRI